MDYLGEEKKEDLMIVFKHMKGDYKKDGDRLLSVAARDRQKVTVLNCTRKI